MDTKELEKLPNKDGEIEKGTAHIIVELIEYEHNAIVSKSIMKKTNTLVKLVFLLFMNLGFSQTYTFPDETDPHEGTWLQWPHQYEYGAAFPNGTDATWVAMTKALVTNEKVHIIAYNATEQTRITNLLTANSVALTNVTFKIAQTNDVWARDNAGIFVRNAAGALVLQDWGFNGWGGRRP